MKVNNNLTQVTIPYLVTELNNRTDFEILDGETGFNVLNSLSAIHFFGSGLYHFSAEITKTDLSFCKMKTEFTVYIDGVPLAYPAQDLVRAITALLFGGVMFAVFLFKLYGADKDKHNL